MINTLYVRGGAGTQNAALAAGGADFPAFCQATEEYDGSSWTAGPNTITIRVYAFSGGSQNAAWLSGGNLGTSPTFLSCTEEYNGSSWSAGGAMITARYYGAGAGGQFTALAIGGQSAATTPAGSTSVEAYDGGSWATETSLINARRIFAGGGIQNAAVAAGVYPGSTNIDNWDGTSSTAGNALLTKAYRSSLSGYQYDKLVIGGDCTTVQNTHTKA